MIPRMQTKISFSTVIYTLTILFIISISVVKAENDDDEILGEVLTDILVGSAVAVCETNAACNGFMTLITIVFIITSLIGWCCNGCRCDDEYYPSRRTMRRAGTSAISYGITRSLMD